MLSPFSIIFQVEWKEETGELYRKFYFCNNNNQLENK